MKTQTIDGKQWVFDGRRNRASIEKWGSEELAILALQSCSGCYDCSRCSGCSGEKRTFDVPTIEDIHRKVFDAASGDGALVMDRWHICDTTHCRAGWVVHLAGKAGYALEQQTSPLFAAMQIYKESGYEISPVRFFDGNASALEDMRRLAEAELAKSVGEVAK